MNAEVVGLYALIAAAALMGLAYLWLLIRAFQSGVWWGLGVLFFAPLALVFIPTHWKASRGPAALFLFAGVVAAGAFVAGQLGVTRDPNIKIVDGEKHITLTRAKFRGYSLIKE